MGIAPRGEGHFRTVYIVTYGRSGSTLLMGLLNTIDGYLIRGENFNCFDHLRRFLDAVHRTSRHPGKDTTHPWFNEIDEASLFAGVRAVHRALLVGPQQPRVYGFKEIRYVDMPRKELFRLLDFLARLDPPAAIVFNTRDWREVRRSKWWAKVRTHTVLRRIRRFERHMRRYLAEHPESCFHIDYADVCAGNERLEALFHFLGESFDPAAHRRVLGTHHSV